MRRDLRPKSSRTRPSSPKDNPGSSFFLQKPTAESPTIVLHQNFTPKPSSGLQKMTQPSSSSKFLQKFDNIKVSRSARNYDVTQQQSFEEEFLKSKPKMNVELVTKGCRKASENQIVVDLLYPEIA